MKALVQTTTTEPLVQSIVDLKHALEKIRHDSVMATRRGDFRTVARLTAEAVRINEKLIIVNQIH